MRFTHKFLVSSLMFLTSLCLALPVQAVTYCVDDFSDGPPNAADCPADCISSTGLCTLRDAIEAANQDMGADEISLPEGTVTLTEVGDNEEGNATGDLDVLAEVNIQGQGLDLTLVQWDPNLSEADRDRVLDADPNGSGIMVEVQDMSLSNGVVAENLVLAPEGGGGIRQGATSTLNLLRVGLMDNSSQSEGGGGLVVQSMATVEDSWVAGNDSNGGGGGIYLTNTADLEMTGSTVSDNEITQAGVGAGGLFMTNGSTWSITNSTISGNTAQSSGGGFLNDGTGTLVNSTITQNTGMTGTGGGLRNQAGTLTIRNTIVAQNSAGGGEVDCDGQTALNSDGSNLIGDGTGCTGLTDGVNNDQVGTMASPIDAMLDPLAQNGGSSPSHYPQTGSPAIDAVALADCPPPNEDQRGQIRPVGVNCDIGSIEVGSADLSITLNADMSSPVQAGTTVTYTWEVTNNGPDSDFDVTVEGTLPSGATIQSLGLCVTGGAGFICSLGTLGDGESLSGAVALILNTNGTNTLSVQVVGTEADPDDTNNSASLSLTVEGGTGGGCLLNNGPMTSGTSGIPWALSLSLLGGIFLLRAKRSWLF